MTFLWRNCLLWLLVCSFWKAFAFLASHAIMLINYSSGLMKKIFSIYDNSNLCLTAEEVFFFGYKCAPAIEFEAGLSHMAYWAPFRYFALRLSNSIISYDWLNSTTETQKTPKKQSSAIHFPYSTSHLGFDTFHVFSVSLLCLFIHNSLFFVLSPFLSCLEEFMMVHYLSINFGWIAFANFNMTFNY